MTKHTVSRPLIVKLVTIALALVVAFGIIAVSGLSTRAYASQNEGLKEYFKSGYDTKAEALKAGLDLNEEIAQEGFILLKNNNSLPLASTARKVTVLGKNSTNMVVGGGGSGSNANAQGMTDIYKALTKDGFDVNPTVKAFYEDKDASGAGRPASPGMGRKLYGFATGETPQASYTKAVKDSYAAYNDAALVVISRIGGEGYELPRYSSVEPKNNEKGTEKLPGAFDINDHYLQLDSYETDLLKAANAAFKNVIVVVNNSTSMELDFLEDEVTYPNVKGAIWVGGIGANGIDALGDILKGDINPSGRTVDTFARDFKKDPTWNNIGDNNAVDGNRLTVDGKAAGGYVVDYEEDIYIGYRYYETRGYEEVLKKADSTWYKDNVVYPLGYGLSYTSFDWAIKDRSIAANAAITKDSEISVTVTVTNKGTAAGKDVVQLYYTAPYAKSTAAKTYIEKPRVVLGGFVKTPLLAAGASADVTITLTAEDMASYDANDINKNSFKGYELEAGSYDIWIAKNAHDTNAALKTTYTVASDIKIQKRNDDKANVVNLFEDVDKGIKAQPNWNGITRDSITTAATSMRTAADLAATQKYIESLDYSTDAKKSYEGATEFYKDKVGQPWYYAAIPTGVRYKDGEVPLAQKDRIQLSELIGLDYNDAKWNTFLNQFTLKELATVSGTGNYFNVAIPEIGKAQIGDVDGPAGVSGTGWVSECVIAATWNADLAEKMGKMIGEESLWTVGKAFSGWYAPAMNIHRSPFSGRNFEYYSEDGFLSGVMAAAATKGAQEKGVYCFIKHFAVNDQETNRDTNGLITWSSEQAMREIYFKPFEMAVKDGGATAVMSSFNRIGDVLACGSYALLTELLRDEWGFQGMVITDYAGAYMPQDLCIRAGNDKRLGNGLPTYVETADKKQTPTQIMALRNSTKNILWTVVNSNAMNESVNLNLSKAIDAQNVRTNAEVKIDVPSFTVTSSYGGTIPAYDIVATTTSTLIEDLKYDPVAKTITFKTGTTAARNQAVNLTFAFKNGVEVKKTSSVAFNVSIMQDYVANQFVGLAKHGEAFTGDVAGVEGTAAGVATTYAITGDKKLPEGLTLANTGKITGTIADTVTAGVYEFTVRSAHNRINVDRTFYIVVAEKPCANLEDHDNVCPKPSDHENVCPKPEDHENVCADKTKHEGCGSDLGGVAGMFIVLALGAGLFLVLKKKSTVK